MNFFGKRKNPYQSEAKKITKVAPLKLRQYPEKILLAWNEAIRGNQKFINFLNENGYKELAMFCYALRSDIKAQDWLRDNGFFHLLAVIHGGEGNQQASEWLHNYKFYTLKYMARAIHGDQVAQSWLLANDKLMAKITRSIEIWKDIEEDRNNDVHSINP